MHWYMDALKNYVNFSDRACRSEYWMFFLFNIIICFVLLIIEGMIGGPGVLANLYSLAVLIPGLAVSVRRLHDTDKSGWWLLVGFVPLLGALLLLIFFVQAGTSGPNSYGQEPA